VISNINHKIWRMLAGALINARRNF
jgi:hypothetical protein